jgi:hypothetical protein
MTPAGDEPPAANVVGLAVLGALRSPPDATDDVTRSWCASHV